MPKRNQSLKGQAPAAKSPAASKSKTPATKSRKRTPVFSWDRLPTETDRAWKLFQIYRDMQVHEGRRSGKSVAERAGVSRQMIEKYMRQNNWTKRAAEYDLWIDQIYTQPEAGRQAVHIVEEQLKAAKAMRAVGMQMLATVADYMKPRIDENGNRLPPRLDPEKYLAQMGRLIKDSVTIERDALGMNSTPTIETSDGDVVINNNLQMNKTVIIALPDNGRG